MSKPDKNRIPRNLEQPGAIDKDGQSMTMEQAAINSLVSMAAALLDMGESLNDLCAEVSIIKELEAKRALKDGIIAPDEFSDYVPDEEEGEEDAGKPD